MPKRESPLWQQFEEFLERQSQASKTKERLGLTTPRTQSGGAPRHECTRCKSKNHNTHRKQRNPPQEKEDGASYCYFCAESHPLGNHTKDYLLGSRAESRKRDAEGAVTGQTTTLCRSCKMEVKDSPQSMWPGRASRGQTSLLRPLS